ncbi:MRN complex-interacting protein isoform X2 [Hyla sarda]|uniref:MRN complex-interacting protein isoform X2 n=1 Tax=Hyla sarda TaxID=327740 RepID=UPI0024C3AC46|nr:MRN complex-interacting protein isoform X2 [Hyla sarda]
MSNGLVMSTDLWLLWATILVYGQGSGADCRHHVQKLNLLQGQVEQAATGTDKESCQNDDDIDDEREKSLAVSQEAASMSCWNKYVEEYQDGAHEEEEEGIFSTDREHYYSPQDCTSRTVRKRKHMPYHGEDFYKEDTKEIISKKNKIYEAGNSTGTSHFSCRNTEDVQLPDEPVSRTLPLQTYPDAFSPRTRSEGHFKQSTCSTACFLKPDMDTIFNCFHNNKKTEPDCTIAISQDTLPNNDPTTTNRLSGQNISSPALNDSGLGSADQQSDLNFKTSSLVSTQKSIIQSNLFRTDEDFDDNY